jgi:DNA-binding beta-propeller fold protein YncE
MTFGTVSAVATDSQDRVYAFQRAEPPVVIFDREGNHVGSWGEGRFENPHGIYIADDIVYLTDREGSIAQKCTLDGTPLLTIGTPGVYSDTGCEVAGEVCPRSAGPFNFVTELVPSPSGDLYVSDGYRNARVHRFSAAGDLISSWGEPGKGGPGEFHLPHSIVAHPNGNLYLCDRENNRMQIYSPDGEFLTMWEDMRRPLDISVDSEANLVISEGGANGMPPRVSIMDPDGNVLARWDSESAHGSWVDAHGNIYMALGAQERVDKYVRQ